MIEVDPSKRLTVSHTWQHRKETTRTKQSTSVSFSCARSRLLAYTFLFLLYQSSFFQLEDVSRHSWVTQYVNGEHTPVHRRNRIPISSNRCTPTSSMKRKNHHHHHHHPQQQPSPSMFVIRIVSLLLPLLLLACSLVRMERRILRRCLFSFVACAPVSFPSVVVAISTEREKNTNELCLLACMFLYRGRGGARCSGLLTVHCLSIFFFFFSSPEGRRRNWSLNCPWCKWSR